MEYARALFAVDSKVRARKMQVLSNLAQQSTVLLLQEVHGTASDVKAFLTYFRREWHILPSLGRDRGTGGLLTLIRKRAFPVNTAITFQHPMPGRACRVSLRSNSTEAIFWNVHNYGLSKPQVTSVGNMISTDTELAKSDPSCVTLFTGGDWNFLAPGDVQN